MAGAALLLGSGLRAAHAADGPQPGDLLVGADDAALKPLGPADLEVGAKQRIVVPLDATAKRARNDSRFNRILLLKLDPGSLNDTTKARAALGGGVLAYSAICKHQACDVNAWRAKEQRLLCFCHLPQFEPADGAAVVSGPAPHPLPSLPLQVDADGRLAVAGAFSAPPGAG